MLHLRKQVVVFKIWKTFSTSSFIIASNMLQILLAAKLQPGPLFCVTYMGPWLEEALYTPLDWEQTENSHWEKTGPLWPQASHKIIALAKHMLI